MYHSGVGHAELLDFSVRRDQLQFVGSLSLESIAGKHDCCRDLKSGE